jgi:hypothetical protein
MSTITTFETAKIGDKVYSPTYGWGEIEYIEDLFSRRPIYVRFFNNDVHSYYTLKGCYCPDLIQSLFWNKVVIKAPTKPKATEL